LRIKDIIILILILVIQFMGPFSGNMIMPMFKALRNDFHVETFSLSLSITFYMFSFSLFQLFSGFICDAFLGRKVTMLLGLTIYFLGSIFISISTSIWIFIFSRVVQGIGNALISPMLLSLIGDLFPKNLHGRVIGLYAVATTIGSSFGPYAGGYFALISWRLGFVILAFISSLSLILSSFLLPKTYSIKKKDWNSFKTEVKNVFVNINFITLSFIGFLLFFSGIGFYNYLSDYLSRPPLNISSDMIGGFLSLSGVGGIISGFIAGYLTDILGRKKTNILGLILYIPVLTLFSTDWWLKFMPLLMFLIGFASTMSITPVNTMIVEIDPDNRGVITSVYGFIRFLGYGLAPMIAYIPYMLMGLCGVVLLSLFSLTLSIVLMILLVK